ncbi:MAG: 2-(5-triphosphoribosyl)-3-dephospho CoA synthase [Firmicutes bacterium]|nr:2-(5-triphosphoribosyl)-3-dephospho CoA synthase [Bacillota bacterium]
MSLSPQDIGRLAVQSLLYEVAVTPKPGLVDRRNVGAHKDMDCFTFLASAAALAPYFTQFAQRGAECSQQEPKAVFREIRSIGIAAERCMFEATAGVNTHKGAIFSLGLACTAAGFLSATHTKLTPQTVAGYVSKMTEGICGQEYQGIEAKKSLTKGEEIYLRYGLTGVRGEAEQGFPSVLRYSYPVLKDCLLCGRSINESMLQAYLHLAGNVDDTNVLGRHDMETSTYVKVETQALLKAGGALNTENIALLEAMDDDFIAQNISPGGCADLLALTIFLFSLAHPEWKYKV